MRRSTPAMRARIRELSQPDSDDYDKAVIAVLDDFEAALAQSDAILRRCERWLRHEVEATFQEEGGYDLWEAVKTALAQSNAEPAPFSFSPQAYQAIEDALAQSDAPPRPDASAGLREAETVIRAMVDACEDQDLDGVITIARTYFARAADRSEKP